MKLSANIVALIAKVRRLVGPMDLEIIEDGVTHGLSTGSSATVFVDKKREDDERFGWVIAHEARHVWQHRKESEYVPHVVMLRDRTEMLVKLFLGLGVTKHEIFDKLHDLLPVEVDADMFATMVVGSNESTYETGKGVDKILARVDRKRRRRGKPNEKV